MTKFADFISEMGLDAVTGFISGIILGIEFGSAELLTEDGNTVSVLAEIIGFVELTGSPGGASLL